MKEEMDTNINLLKITVDTNILVSATIVQGNQYKLLKLAKEGKIKIFISIDILKEFKEVISRPKFGFSEDQINDALKHIISISEIVFPTVKLDIVKEDPDDNIILECAASAGSHYIVSGDRHLLNLKEYKRIKIVRSADILNLFDKTYK